MALKNNEYEIKHEFVPYLLPLATQNTKPFIELYMINKIFASMIIRYAKWVIILRFVIKQNLRVL